MSHFLISAAHKSSGKTTISIGVCAALRARGLQVRPFKKGPDYIDPLWLGSASGRPCHNLDFYTMQRDEIRSVFARHMQGGDIGVIEGNKGLFDGMDLEGGNSNAALAELLQAPVVLVIDTRGMTRGIAPLLLGYQSFGPELNIAGVILNMVGGPRHEGKLRQVVEHYTDIPVLGAVPRDPRLQIDERHLGLMPSNESADSQELIARLAGAVSDHVDLDALLALAATAPQVGAEETMSADRAEQSLRIGIARDEAFGFYYAGDLEKLQEQGAELVPFDCLHDQALPEVDGLFIGGGFPETRMRELEANGAMRAAIHRFVEQGGPIYAECGGLMYLARSLTWQGNRCKMVGTIPADAVMHERPQGRGYVKLAETGEGPWPACAGDTIAAHEFHYSALENLDAEVRFAYRVLRGTGVDGEHDGIVYKNLLASYTHLRDVGGNDWTRRFLAHVRTCREAARP